MALALSHLLKSKVSGQTNRQEDNKAPFTPDHFVARGLKLQYARKKAQRQKSVVFYGDC